MNVLDLFSGIGGFSLGLERAGMRTVAFCEIDPFCRRVLAKHWPSVPCYDDVRSLTAYNLRADGITPDVICGGFPCQDISEAGKGAGIDGERSGLWIEYARIISGVRPKFVLVENTSALLTRGLQRVIGDLAGIGYDAEWSIVSACALGAPHPRERMFILAYPEGEWRQQCGRFKFDAVREVARNLHQRFREPEPARVAYGIPNRTHRNSAIGNAVMPQIPEIIGRAIMSATLSSQDRT
jgi:DNA (cytosine-5)-methyltransferase 1